MSAKPAVQVPNFLAEGKDLKRIETPPHGDQEGMVYQAEERDMQHHDRQGRNSRPGVHKQREDDTVALPLPWFQRV
ncbi:hypothetical protein D3C86_832460 [compost metagenome]